MLIIHVNTSVVHDINDMDAYLRTQMGTSGALVGHFRSLDVVRVFARCLRLVGLVMTVCITSRILI